MTSSTFKKTTYLTIFTYIFFVFTYLHPKIQTGERDGVQLMLEGESHYREIDYLEALNKFKKAKELLTSEHYLIRIYLNLAKTHYALSDNENTQKALRKLFEIQPRHIIDDRYYPKGFMALYESIKSEIAKKLEAQVIPHKGKRNRRKWKSLALVALGAVVGGSILLILLRSKKEPVPIQSSVQVYIQSTPIGAQIYVDGEDRGAATPAKITVNPGKREILLSKENCCQAVNSILFEANKNYTINVQLSGYSYEFMESLDTHGDIYHDSTKWITIDKEDNIYYLSDSIWVYKLNPAGITLNNWLVKESWFLQTTGIASDINNNIYVTASTSNPLLNRYREEIYEYDSSGKFRKRWGAKGTQDGQFDLIRAIAVGNDLSIYISDYKNNRIQVFDSKRNFLKKWYASHPGDLDIDKNNNVYVCQDENRIYKYDSNGIVISEWGSEGSDDGQFNRLSGIAVDENTNVFVADEYNHRVQKFDSDGFFITKWGTRGSREGSFAYPMDVAVDSAEYVYISDTGNGRIQKFRITDQTDSNGDWQIHSTNRPNISGSNKLIPFQSNKSNKNRTAIEEKRKEK